MALRWIMRIRHRILASAIFRRPLVRTGRTLGQLPVVAEQVGEEVVAPLGRRLGPDDFQTAADRVAAETFAKLIFPSQALVFDGGSFWVVSHILRGNAGAVRLAEGVTAGD